MTLTLAHMDENSYIPTYIDEFNRSHSDIRVELLPEMPHEALVALMASDDAPDIIGFGYNSPESMAAKGWLLDMYTLMGDFPREDFLLGPFETDGALYALSPEYHVYTLVGLEADFGNAYVHPISDFKDMGVHYYGDAFLTYSIPLWIQQNRQGAGCDFTSPEFLELLEAARSGYMAQCTLEEGEDGALVRVECADPDQTPGEGREITLWFTPDTHALVRGEISVDGLRVIECTLTEFSMG